MPQSAPDSARPCKLKASAQCSDSSPCCNSKCQPRSDESLCAEKTDCLQESKCDGKSAECPPQKPLPVGTFCQNNTGTCGASGKCDRNVCEHYGQGKACMCAGEWFWYGKEGEPRIVYKRQPDVEGQADGDTCFVCCQKPSAGGGEGECKRLTVDGKAHPYYYRACVIPFLQLSWTSASAQVWTRGCPSAREFREKTK